MQRRAWAVVAAVTIGWLAGAGVRAADPPTEATVTDFENKEHKVAGLKFGTGTQRLTWAADDSKKAPLVLEVREPNSTAYVKGIVTYVPLDSVESIKFESEKKLSVVAVKGLAEPVTGTLRYQNLNVLTFTGTVDGKATSFRGGPGSKAGIKGVAFAGAVPIPARKGGTAWGVQIDQPEAENPTLKAANLKFLYQFPGGVQELTAAAPVRKGEPLKFDDVQSLVPVAVDPNTRMTAVEVVVGTAEKVVILSPLEKDGKTGYLVGLVGEVEAGWKLFPLSVIKGAKRPKKD